MRVNVTETVFAGAGVTSLLSYATGKLHSNLTDSVYNKHARVIAPAGIVSIVIPALNEEATIATALKSILSQNIIAKHTDYFECIVVDNDSTDRTAEIAKRYCQVIYAPKGKLNARHAGIKYAVGDIIVACDADCYYPPNWLNLLLRHFHRPDVVAVNAPYLLQGNLLHRTISVWNVTLSPFPKQRLYGANSAFLKSAYYEVNGFDLSIDQYSFEEVLMEEEIVLYGKLRSLGTVIFDKQAPCFTILRRGRLRTMKRTKVIEKTDRVTGSVEQTCV